MNSHKKRHRVKKFTKKRSSEEIESEGEEVVEEEDKELDNEDMSDLIETDSDYSPENSSIHIKKEKLPRKAKNPQKVKFDFSLK